MTNSQVSVGVNPAGLPVGVYQGTVTISCFCYPPAQVPVKLVVWNDPVPLVTVNPSALVFTVPGGRSAVQTVRFATGDIPVPWTVSVETADGDRWLLAGASNMTGGACKHDGPCPDFTPTTVDITANTKNLAPGTYHGTVAITAPWDRGYSVTVPVTLNVTAAMPLP